MTRRARAHLLRSAGKPFPWVELRIVDGEERDCPVGEVGELWTRSGQNMKGYWNRPEETKATITADGWLKTGDAGYLDADGYVFLTDRVKDMIVSGGENIYPAEIENVLASHPAVAEVAVIGVPDEKWGETVKAVIATKPAQTVTAADDPRLRQDASGRLQMPDVGRFRRRSAAQSLRQGSQEGPARALLGRQGAPHQLRPRRTIIVIPGLVLACPPG